MEGSRVEKVGGETRCAGPLALSCPQEPRPVLLRMEACALGGVRARECAGR